MNEAVFLVLGAVSVIAILAGIGSTRNAIQRAQQSVELSFGGLETRLRLMNNHAALGDGEGPIRADVLAHEVIRRKYADVPMSEAVRVVLGLRRVLRAHDDADVRKWIRSGAL